MEWTGVRYADKPTVEAETWIDAPPESVWQVVADVELMPEFSDELQSAEWCDGAEGPALGNAFVGRNKHQALGEWETTSYIVECERPRVFSWAVQDVASPTATWRFSLEPRDGGTQLRQWVRIGPGRSGLSIAIERTPEKEQKIVFVRMCEFEGALSSTLSAIKKRVEGSRNAEA
ncbi:MAG: SRPBCC family protein [Sciscionella sp.]